MVVNGIMTKTVIREGVVAAPSGAGFPHRRRRRQSFPPGPESARASLPCTLSSVVFTGAFGVGIRPPGLEPFRQPAGIRYGLRGQLAGIVFLHLFRAPCEVASADGFQRISGLRLAHAAEQRRVRRPPVAQVEVQRPFHRIQRTVGCTPVCAKLFAVERRGHAEGEKLFQGVVRQAEQLRCACCHPSGSSRRSAASFSCISVQARPPLPV